MSFVAVDPDNKLLLPRLEIGRKLNRERLAVADVATDLLPVKPNVRIIIDTAEENDVVL